MSKVKVKDLSEEDCLYAEIMYRCLVNNGYPLDVFSDDADQILSLVQRVMRIELKNEELNLKRVRINAVINIAAKNEDDKVYTVRKVLKEDSGEFVLEE